MRDLLGVFIDAGQALPADGAGGEGFDNARETLFISPIHAEKYLEAARNAIGYAWTEPRSRDRMVMAEPGEDQTAQQAAERVLAEFLPRAFRRPVTDDERAKYLSLFQYGACNKMAPSTRLCGSPWKPYSLHPSSCSCTSSRIPSPDRSC